MQLSSHLLGARVYGIHLRPGVNNYTRTLKLILADGNVLTRNNDSRTAPRRSANTAPIGNQTYPPDTAIKTHFKREIQMKRWVKHWHG